MRPDLAGPVHLQLETYYRLPRCNFSQVRFQLRPREPIRSRVRYKGRVPAFSISRIPAYPLHHRYVHTRFLFLLAHSPPS